MIQKDDRVRLNAKGEEVLRLLGKPLGTDIRVSSFLGGWVRLSDPSWEAPGHLFTRSEFEAVEEAVEPEVKVREVQEVRAIEVRLYDVIWVGKDITVVAIDAWGTDAVMLFGKGGSGERVTIIRELDEYVTLSGRREV